jgi:hypothetical protein
MLLFAAVHDVLIVGGIIVLLGTIAAIAAAKGAPGVESRLCDAPAVPSPSEAELTPPSPMTDVSIIENVVPDGAVLLNGKPVEDDQPLEYRVITVIRKGITQTFLLRIFEQKTEMVELWDADE